MPFIDNDSSVWALEHDAGIQQCLQEVAGSPYPLDEEAVAISQLPTRWGGLGLTSAQRLAAAGWLGLWAHAWKKMVVMFPAVRDLLPHLGAPEGTGFGGHPLVAGLAAAMEDVRGGRAWVLAAEREEHPVPEGLQIPAEAPGWEGFGDDRPPSQKELTISRYDKREVGKRKLLLFYFQLGITIPLVREVSAVGTGRCPCGDVADQFGYHYLDCSNRGMFIYRHDAVQDVLVEMLRKVWGRMMVLFPAVRDMLPHLGAPEDSEAGEHPLAAGMIAAMGDVRGPPVPRLPRGFFTPRGGRAVGPFGAGVDEMRPPSFWRFFEGGGSVLASAVVSLGGGGGGALLLSDGHKLALGGGPYSWTVGGGVGSGGVADGRCDRQQGVFLCDLGVCTTSPSSPRGVFTSCTARCPAGWVLMRIGPIGSASIRGHRLKERFHHGVGGRAGGRTEQTGRRAQRAANGGSCGGVGRLGQGARRRRTVRTMESLTREVGGAEEADIAGVGSGQAEGLAQEERQEPSPQRDCWGLGAGVLGRRVRVRWPAEGASFDGVVHAWVPGEGRHVVRYDDGDEVSHDLCEEQVEWLAGESGQRAQVAAATVGVPDVVEPEVAAERAVPLAEVSPSLCRPAPLDMLQSPPVPEGLADLLRTPGAVPRAGLDAEAEVDDAEQVHRVGVADVSGTPRPSPGMGGRLYIGPLFRPVEEEWCGHSMCSMPPTGVVADDGSTATFSWVFCPLILDAVGWRSASPICQGVVSGPDLWTGRRQEELLELNQQVGQEVQLFAANMVAEARQGLQPPGRVPGAMGSVGPAGSRSPRPEVAPRGDDQPPTVGEGGAAAVADEVRMAVPEACDAPVVEAEEAGGAEQVGGAQLEATALPAEVVMVEYAMAAGDVEDRPGYVRGVPQLSGRDCSVCLGEFRVGQAFSIRGSGKSNSSNIGGNNNNSGEGSSGGRKSSHRGSSSSNSNNKDNKSSNSCSSDGSNTSNGNNDSNSSSSSNSGRASIGNSSSREGSFVSRDGKWSGRCRSEWPGAVFCRSRGVFGGRRQTVLMTHRRGMMSPPTDVPRQEAGAEAGAGGAQRRERPVDPVIPEASMVAGEWEALFSAAVPSAPVWPARASEERVMSDVISLVKEGQLGKAIRRLDPGVLAPLTPETIEALQVLHPVGDGLPASVQAAPLVLEETAVEAECRRMPVASGPGCSQLRFEHLDAVFGAGDGVSAIHHACEQIVSNRIPAEVQPWIMGARLVALLKPGGGVRPIVCGEPVLREILRAHPEVYIIAYLDGIHILGEPERVREAYDAAVPLLANIGLELNVGKSAVFSPSGACEAFQDVVDAGGEPMPGAVEVAGSPYPLGEEAVAWSQLPTRCGGVVDEFGYHYLACNRMGMFTYRHDAAQDVLVEMSRKAKKFLEKCAGGDALQLLKMRDGLKRFCAHEEEKSQDRMKQIETE
ncbi:hypothetical protein CYMTET_33602 [Cymbomonas tetramitiformis]|uniref:Reverse transcriptase domain-containing protein n=1 Tax=Cymbomonas tetramitiformis TaxID=36881 RepID=A0AAE0FCT8_9CHLO|nr:hypothetical protein CYMTET_33602 [Cymbomonas tetramitiformis]